MAQNSWANSQNALPNSSFTVELYESDQIKPICFSSFISQTLEFLSLNDWLFAYSCKGTSKKALNKEELTVIHERLLRANTDYGRYNPSPALSKPHSKLIPN